MCAYTHLDDLNVPARVPRAVAGATGDNDVTPASQNYTGHNFVGHSYIGHNDTGHACIGQRNVVMTCNRQPGTPLHCIGHNHVGHTYTGNKYVAMT